MFCSSYFTTLPPVEGLKKIVLANGSVALKWEHPHGFMEGKMYLYKVEVNGETKVILLNTNTLAISTDFKKIGALFR